MHPVQHAHSSHRRFGGDFNTHLAFHNRFDQSKACHFDPRHRMLHHHVEGARIIAQHFSKTLDHAESCAVLHLIEDFNRPNVFARDWINCASHHLDPLLLDTPRGLDALLALGPWAVELNHWLCTPSKWVDDHPYWPLFRLHAYGCFDAEQTFGPTIDPQGNMPTRVLAERLIRAHMGRVAPYTTLISKRIPIMSWMTASVRAASLDCVLPSLSDLH